jgi:uncharacterized phage protein gp47/JayE
VFEAQTKDAILSRMLAKIDSNMDKRQGSIIYDLLSPKAIELELAYMTLDNVLNWGFADTSYGPYLDLRCKEVGITRKPALKSVGVVTVTGPADQIVPLGTVFTTGGNTPIRFATTVEATLYAGTQNIACEAVIAGSEGNVALGAINSVEGPLGALITVTNALAFADGKGEETDDDLRARYYERVQNPSASGTISDYKQWATEMQGISDARIYPLWNGGGTVKVVLLSESKRTPSDVLVAAVYDHIEAKRPIGATVTVVGAQEVPIDIDVKVTLKAGGDLNAAKADITQKVIDYLADLAFNDLIVRYTRIGDIILNASQVVDYTNFKLNDLTHNVEVNDDQVGVLGRVTVTI